LRTFDRKVDLAAAEDSINSLAGLLARHRSSVVRHTSTVQSIAKQEVCRPYATVATVAATVAPDLSN